MRKTLGMMMVGLLVAGPVVGQVGPPRGQGWAPGAGPWLDGPRNPITAMLSHREALRLTDEQVTQLEAIEARLEEEARPLMEELDELRGDAPIRARDGSYLDMSESEREALRERVVEVRELAFEVRALNRAAGVQAHAVLEPGQRAVAYQFLMRRAGMRHPGFRPGARGAWDRGGARGGHGAWSGRGARGGRWAPAGPPAGYGWPEG